MDYLNTLEEIKKKFERALHWFHCSAELLKRTDLRTHVRTFCLESAQNFKFLTWNFWHHLTTKISHLVFFLAISAHNFAQTCMKVNSDRAKKNTFRMSAVECSSFAILQFCITAVLQYFSRLYYFFLSVHSSLRQRTTTLIHKRFIMETFDQNNFLARRFKCWRKKAFSKWQCTP